VVELSELTIRRADASEHTVNATISVGPRMSCSRQLLWTLQPTPERGQLRLVRDPCPSDEPDPSDGAARLTAAASRLAQADGTGQVGSVIVQLAASYLPQAGSVWLLLQSWPIAETGIDRTEARELISLQLRLGEGPLAEPATDGPLISRDLSRDARWPRLRTLMPPRATAALAVALPSVHAMIFAVAAESGAFDDVDRAVLQQFAVQAGIALSRAVTVDQLEKAIATRQVIGGAVGILMERHRITPDQAFERLVRASQHANVKLRDIATRLVETGEEPALTPDSQVR
jgi:GAF domain-containing protein